MSNSSAGEYWNENFVPVFVEKIFIPLCVAVIILIIGTNPMGLDWTQRITGGIAILLVLYFAAHTLHKRSQAASKPSVPNIIRQHSTGKNSPNIVTGDSSKIDINNKE